MLPEPADALATAFSIVQAIHAAWKQAKDNRESCRALYQRSVHVYKVMKKMKQRQLHAGHTVKEVIKILRNTRDVVHMIGNRGTFSGMLHCKSDEKSIDGINVELDRALQLLGIDLQMEQLFILKLQIEKAKQKDGITAIQPHHSHGGGHRGGHYGGRHDHSHGHHGHGHGGGGSHHSHGHSRGGAAHSHGHGGFHHGRGSGQSDPPSPPSDTPSNNPVYTPPPPPPPPPPIGESTGPTPVLIPLPNVDFIPPPLVPSDTPSTVVRRADADDPPGAAEGITEEEFVNLGAMSGKGHAELQSMFHRYSKSGVVNVEDVLDGDDTDEPSKCIRCNQNDSSPGAEVCETCKEAFSEEVKNLCSICQVNQKNAGFAYCQTCFDNLCKKCRKTVKNGKFDWCKQCFMEKKLKGGSSFGSSFTSADSSPFTPVCSTCHKNAANPGHPFCTPCYKAKKSAH